MISYGIECTSKSPRGEGREDNVIPFSTRDLVGVHDPNNDNVIMSMMIAKNNIKGILVNSRSLADILSYDVFVWMDLPLSCLTPVLMSLVGFTRDLVRVEGEIPFPS